MLFAMFYDEDLALVWGFPRDVNYLILIVMASAMLFECPIERKQRFRMWEFPMWLCGVFVAVAWELRGMPSREAGLMGVAVWVATKWYDQVRNAHVVAVAMASSPLPVIASSPLPVIASSSLPAIASSSLPAIASSVSSSSSPSQPVETKSPGADSTQASEGNFFEDEGKMLLKALAPEIIFSMLTNSDVLVSALCDRNGILLWVSQSSSTIHGYEPKEMLGTNGWKTIHPDDVERIRNTSPLDEKNRTQNVYRRKHKSGEYTWMESFGLHSEGYVFFQEHALSYERHAMAKYDFTLGSMRAVGEMFSSPGRIDEDALNSLVNWRNDELLGKIELTSGINFDECIAEVVASGVRIRDSNQRGVGFMVDRDATATGLLIRTNRVRFLQALTSMLYSFFSNSKPSSVVEFHFHLSQDEVSNGLLLRIWFKFTKSDPLTKLDRITDDARMECAKSFLKLAHHSDLSVVYEDVCRTVAFRIRFPESHVATQQDVANSTSNVDTCLIIDDDPVMLALITRNLPKAWKMIEDNTSSLVVITVSSGEQALKLIANSVDRLAYAFVCVDLNLEDGGSGEQVMSGRETILELKRLNAANRYLAISGTIENAVELVDSGLVDAALEKSSEDFFQSVCEYGRSGGSGCSVHI